MNYKLLIYCLSAVIVLFYSCKKDVFEIDLTDKNVTLLAPPDNYQTNVLTQTFWWVEVEGATGYNLQIVSPSFTSIQQLILDSIPTDNKFTHTLNPGSYEWRVRAMNSSSSTGYTTYSLTIESTNDVSSQIIVVLSPSNNLITNQMAHTFKWDTLYNADDYRFEIATPDFNGTQVISPVIITADSITHTFTTEGQYEWRVRGQNSSSNTPYTTYSMEIDTTRPNTPVLVSPGNNAVLPDSTFTLFWDRGTVTGTTIMDSLYIYSDSLMTNLVLGYYTANTSYSDTLGISSYFWRVRSIDAAANSSNYSNLNKFIIQ